MNISNYIEDYIQFIFNDIETITFDNQEIQSEVIFKNGDENTLYLSENGKGFSMKEPKGRTFEFSIQPNCTYTTRKKWLQLIELTSKPYTLFFIFNKYLSYVPNFPPSTNIPFSPNPVLQPYGVDFANCVITYANESAEKNKQGLGLRIGLDQAIPVLVTESEPISALFPCSNVADSMFYFGVDSMETPPASGFWYLFDYAFTLNGTQTLIDSILQYPAHGEYWVLPDPCVPGTGAVLDRNGVLPFPNKYSEQLGPTTFATGTEITVQWTNVVLQLASGVICNSTTVTKTFTVG